MATVNEIEQLFRSNYTAMYTLACRLMHDSEVARDIVHDVFASLLKDCPPYVSSAFLLKGVRFACMKYMRNLDVRARLKECYALDISEIDEDDWPTDEDVSRLNAIVDTMLSEQCRRVVRLRFNARLAYKDIAEEIGISETAVYKHLRHAMNVLRKYFLS